MSPMSAWAKGLSGSIAFSFFGGFDEEAMRLSDLVIDTLVARP